MKKFIINIIFISSIVLSLYLLLSFSLNEPPKQRNDYMAGMIAKHKRASEIKGPKLVFMGGSNLAFGLNSKEIQDEFSIPVVNMGLHAGLGLEFMLNELKPCVNKNDIVVLSIEHLLGEGEHELKKYMSSLYSESSDFYHFSITKDMSAHINKTRKNLKKIINEKDEKDEKENTYSRAVFNKFGDLISHLNQKAPDQISGKHIFKYRYWEGISLLNQFNAYAKANDFNVFFIYPSYPKSLYIENETVLKKYQNDLESDLKIEILAKPKAFIFEDSLFYNTVYHLHAKGREMRTKRMINIINENTNVKHCIKKITTPSLPH